MTKQFHQVNNPRYKQQNKKSREKKSTQHLGFTSKENISDSET